MIDKSPIIYEDNYIKRWYIQDKHNNNYKLKKLSLTIDNTKNTVIFRPNRLTNILSKLDFKLFLQITDFHQIPV